jgi:hypothetical protein
MASFLSYLAVKKNYTDFNFFLTPAFAHVKKAKINRKFRVATEIGSTFFGCWSVTWQLKK